VLVAEEATGVAGFVVIGAARDREDTDAGAGKVYALNVDRWRTGAGSALLHAAEQRLVALGYQQALGAAGQPARPTVLRGVRLELRRGPANRGRPGGRRAGDPAPRPLPAS
jgi:L-amino acid N-acyltransferase YncA